MPSKAVVRNVGISTKRFMPLVGTLKGKRVQEALEALRFVPGPTAAKVAEALKSAAANAENNANQNPERLVVVAAYVDGSFFLPRSRARSRGRVGRVKRRLSHLTIVVDEQEGA
ncbi:MAG: 50S ribosomal protein L22 [SAR202 cluster bacterium]|nr:50S ribosomal protein L22 [SAR202 cluster bacterium]